MKFCFAIMLLHGSHRSYPSRRRACFSIKVVCSHLKILLAFWTLCVDNIWDFHFQRFINDMKSRITQLHGHRIIEIFLFEPDDYKKNLYLSSTTMVAVEVQPQHVSSFWGSFYFWEVFYIFGNILLGYIHFRCCLHF